MSLGDQGRKRECVSMQSFAVPWGALSRVGASVPDLTFTRAVVETPPTGHLRWALARLQPGQEQCFCAVSRCDPQDKQCFWHKARSELDCLSLLK